MKTVLILILVIVGIVPNSALSVRIPPTKTDTVYITNCPTDSLKIQLFLSNYKIERVKYYCAIVNKKPSQLKYLKGWVLRAVK